MPERRPILLAVGDDAEILRTLTRDLRRRYRTRFRILRAPGGERAMATLRALAGAGQPVALVIADQGLATMSGLDLLARIRDLLRGTRTVLLTPYSETEAAIRAMDAGAVDDHVVAVRRLDDGDRETLAVSSMYVFIGAVPCTDWLAHTLEREQRGYLLTGPDLGRRSVSDGNGSGREPYLLETSVPGVFAAGDVRNRSMKRVASAVGEGATAIALIHQYLQRGDQ